MTRSRWAAVAAAVAAVVLVGAGAFWLLGSDGGPKDTAARFTAAWSRGDYAAMRDLSAGAPADLTARLAKQRDDLGATAQEYKVASVGKPKGGEAGGAYSARLTLAGGRVWSYDGTLGFTKSGGKWKVDWAPTVLYPTLKEGQRLQAARAWPNRGRIEYADGSSMEGSSSGSVQQLVGPVGPAADDVVKKLGAPYRKGDTVGVDGLNKQYEKRLAGTPALTVQIVDAGGRPVTTLKRFGGQDGSPLRTTVDARVQKAAGQALSAVDKPASVVALRPSTGEILAVANKPGGLNRALLGHYPPGSTFKVVTAAALVAGGMDAGTPVPCPATINIGGRTFKNYQHESFGTPPLREAFAHSCNTTFAQLAVQKLGREKLTAVAQQFGFNAPVVGGLPAVRALFPAAKDDTAFAAEAFGQGEVLTSPLNMASVAGAAADGTWRTPRIVAADLAPQAADAAGRRPEPPHRLDPAVKTALHSLMPAVVTEGTAHAVSFPSGTAGKTGTAEFGGGENPPTHAWFIGYRGDLAFAVIVEGGGTGAEAAAPIAASFLKAVS
ncbi:hypothetical protein DZF91_27645 [Actinomadura logoneensis]|uniref:Penicillin-binding protein n=1 Tax=Actinomadura logoneensis TaxID=2293572 RepID=A0A372JGH0_9ACTN|nr:penicillin-binding transpeptidase domain-containing protein [Actinomadura logoneensis]RFU38448.1 hypothetical protein DZF91_27645 [Actinomadura logoneensis]